MKLRRLSMITLLLVTSLSWLGASRAYGDLVLKATFDSSITSDPNAANIENTINQAIQVYEKLFTNNITVTINFKEMSSGLGSSNFYYYNISYAQVHRRVAEQRDAPPTTRSPWLISRLARQIP